jgi:hypothetical protein
MAGLMVGRTVGLVVGLVFGPLAGLMTAWEVGSEITKQEGRATGLHIGLVAGEQGLDAGLELGLVTAMTYGLVAGLVGGLIKWVGTPSRTGWASTPRSTYKATRVLTAIQLCIGGFGVALLFWLAFELQALLSELQIGVVVQNGQVFDDSLRFGLVLGMVGALGLITNGGWFSYKLSSYWLAGLGKLPLRLMDFLDDAHRLGLLRTVGPAYQFRHAEFHDHLIRRAGQGGKS